MKRNVLVMAIAAALVAGCASHSALKSPCAGAPGSPCSHLPLLNEPIEVSA